jgi:uncharacterized protein
LASDQPDANVRRPIAPGAVSRDELTRALGPLGDRISGNARAEPLGPGERIETIDALRGLALFGVLIINVVTEFRVSIFERFLVHPPTRAASDATLHTLLTTLLSQKALSLFSLLFGLGLAIQFDRLGENPHRLNLLLRRLAALLGIGIVHLILIWNGDILADTRSRDLSCSHFCTDRAGLQPRRALHSSAFNWRRRFFPRSSRFPRRLGLHRKQQRRRTRMARVGLPKCLPSDYTRSRPFWCSMF